jgi:hypothetical protein
MKTVLYIDGSPLYLTEIKRSANGKIIHGHVKNGDWELRLNSTEVYAFEDHTRYGWGDDLVLRSQQEYSTYEEYETDVVGDYNTVIAATNKLRAAK